MWAITSSIDHSEGSADILGGPSEGVVEVAASCSAVKFMSHKIMILENINT